MKIRVAVLVLLWVHLSLTPIFTKKIRLMEHTISITSIRLRSVWYFFKLSWWGLKIMRQAQALPGLVHFANTGFGYTHYTMSAWDNEDSMRQFAYADGAHKAAMKESRKMATEIRTYTYRSKDLPDWKSAKRLVGEKGKVLSFR